MGCTIIGCGKALPALEVTNDDLSKIVDTDDEWITTRTGIKSRRIATTETATDLAASAALAAMAQPTPADIETAGWCPQPIDPQSIDAVICMSIGPDTVLPSQAAMVKKALGLDRAIAFNLDAACASCVYGLATAERIIAAAHAQGAAVGNPINRVLVVGVEVFSRIVDWTDRSTCVLFGDGSGATIIEWSDDEPGIMSVFQKNTDDTTFALGMANTFPESPLPFASTGTSTQSVTDLPENTLIAMDGQRVFKFATSSMIEAIDIALDRASLKLEDLSLIVPHQANERIIRYAAKKLGVSEDLFQLSIEHVANTGGASALMALCDAYSNGSIKQGDKVAIVAFGAGLAAGALTFQA